MKASREQIERAIDGGAGDTRLFFLYGPDEAGSHALATRLEKAMGQGAERIDLDGATLKSDPARLADEAASLSMFGDRRWIKITPLGEEALPAIEALLEAPQAGNPAIAVAGALKASAKIVKLCLDHPAVLTLASYVPDERQAAQIAIAMAREQGLALPGPLAHRIAELTGSDRALMAGEIEKFVLYLDADPERPRELDAQTLDALSAQAVEADPGPLVNAVMGGNVDALNQELAMLGVRGAALASVFRPLMNRAMLLAAIRAEWDQGGRLEAAMEKAGRAIFWKEKSVVQAQVKRWDAPAIARAIHRLSAAERATRDSRGPGELAARHELLTIARQAARER